MNLDSIIEWDMQVCFLEDQLIDPPIRVKIQPKIDLLSLILVIQLASMNPSI